MPSAAKAVGHDHAILRINFDLSKNVPSPPKSPDSSTGFSTKPVKAPLKEKPHNSPLAAYNSAHANILQDLSPIVIFEQSYQELDQLIKVVDAKKEQDELGCSFQWVDIGLRTKDGDYYRILFHLLQSCAISDPNIIRHRDLIYICEDRQSVRLCLLSEQPTGSTLQDLQDYYLTYPTRFKASIFWDIAAQLFTGVDAISQYNVNTAPLNMWSLSQLTAANIFLTEAGQLKLPQYLHFIDNNANAQEKTAKKRKTKENPPNVTAPAKNTDADKKNLIVTILGDMLQVTKYFQQVDAMDRSAQRIEQKAVRNFLKKLTGSKPAAMMDFLKYKDITAAIALRQSGSAPQYPFQSETEKASYKELLSSSRGPVDTSASNIPMLNVTSEADTNSDWIFPNSTDSSLILDPPTPSQFDADVAGLALSDANIPRGFLSHANLTIFRRKNSMLKRPPSRDQSGISDSTYDDFNTISLKYLFYKDIYRGFRQNKLIGEKETTPTSKTMSKAVNRKDLGGRKSILLKIVFEDKKLVSDPFHGIGKENEAPPAATLAHVKSTASGILNRKRRTQELFTDKHLEQIRAFYKTNDPYEPNGNREYVCPSTLYLVKITDSKNYDDIDIYINKSKVFTLLLSLDETNRLTTLEPRIISFLQREAIMAKLIDCYLLGEIAEETPILAAKQKKEVYGLFPKLIAQISTNSDLFDAILKNERFSNAFSDTMITAEQLLYNTTEKGKEHLKFKEILINKVRRETFELFLQEILSRPNSSFLMHTILGKNYEKAMQTLLQLQFASSTVKMGIQLGFFDIPLTSLTLDTLLDLIQDMVVAGSDSNIGGAICLSEHLVVCLLHDPTKVKWLANQPNKPSNYLQQLIFSEDIAHVFFSTSVIEMLSLNCSIQLCTIIHTSAVARMDPNQRQVDDIVGFMATLTDTLAKTFEKRARPLASGDAIVVRQVLLVVLRLLLVVGDGMSAVLGKNAIARNQKITDEHTKIFKAWYLTQYESHHNSMGLPIDAGLDVPEDWMSEANASFRSQLRSIFRNVGKIVGESVWDLFHRISETKDLQNCTELFFLVGRIWILLADILRVLNVNPAPYMNTKHIKARLQVYKSRAHTQKSKVQHTPEAAFILAVLRKILTMAMLPENKILNLKAQSVQQTNVVPTILEESHWTWIAGNTDKVDAAAAMFNLSGDDVIDALKDLTVTKGESC